MSTLATKGFEEALEHFDDLASTSPSSRETYRARRLLIAEARLLIRAIDSRLESCETKLGLNK